ncbi:MAG: helix-turn-helix domain-containing protein [Clostridia bacterium]
MDINVASRLYELRRKKGMSQEELADAIGVTRQAVSKWERGESSPDTDNLIALARLYEVSLDELVGLTVDREQRDNEQVDSGEQQEGDFDNKEDSSYININSDNIDIASGKSRVNINSSGIYINDGKEEVSINKSIKNPIKKNLYSSSILSLVVVIAYILLGSIGGWWHPGWLVFLLIPIISGVEFSIRQKNPMAFPYPLICVLIYLILGFRWSFWHPYWVIFITIPLYYTIVNAIRKSSKAS